MNLSAEKVNEVFRHCLFKDEELPGDGNPPADAVLVEGLTQKFGLHPGRLEEKKAIIKSFLDDLPTEFHPADKGGGGGMSFLNMCMDKEGNHWGEHPTMQELVVLGIATKQMQYCAPRELWSVLPGGVPYVVTT